MSLVNPTPEKFGPLGQMVDEESHERDLDAKILCTSHNSRPGLGKTTWAIQFARALDPNDWSAEEKAFLDPYEYMSAYDDVEPGSVLILDEIGVAGDSRRSMSSKNVSLIQMWETKRYRNIITIGTLPTTSVLDKKLIELSDYRVNIMRRGVAKAFQISIPDFPPHKPWQEPMDGVIDFNDLPDDDPDKEYLDKEKTDYTSIDRNYYTEDDVEQIKTKLERKFKKKFRDQFIKDMYRIGGLSPKKISKFDAVDLSKRSIYDIVENVEKEVTDDNNFRNWALKKLYENTEMTTTDLSNKAGVSQPHVSRIVNSD